MTAGGVEMDALCLRQLAEALSSVPGVLAVALGGSRSRGEASAQSDYDIGVYYEPGALDTAALGACVRALDDGHGEGLLHPPGEWGPWVNGGAWLTVCGAPVDILLRDAERVEAVLEDCLAGRVTVDYQCGHPFGFVNTIYAAEVHYCRPLWQAEGRPLDRLKAMLSADGCYPRALREAAVRKFLWEAWFSLACARKPALGGDVHLALGSAFRTVCAWVQALFALNDRYLMNEKGALKAVAGLQTRPDAMESRVLGAYGLLSSGRAAEALAALDGLHEEISALCAGLLPPETRIR